MSKDASVFLARLLCSIVLAGIIALIPIEFLRLLLSDSYPTLLTVSKGSLFVVAIALFLLNDTFRSTRDRALELSAGAALYLFDAGYFVARRRKGIMFLALVAGIFGLPAVIVATVLVEKGIRTTRDAERDYRKTWDGLVALVTDARIDGSANQELNTWITSARELPSISGQEVSAMKACIPSLSILLPSPTPSDADRLGPFPERCGRAARALPAGEEMSSLATRVIELLRARLLIRAAQNGCYPEYSTEAAQALLAARQATDNPKACEQPWELPVKQMVALECALYNFEGVLASWDAANEGGSLNDKIEALNRAHDAFSHVGVLASSVNLKRFISRATNNYEDIRLRVFSMILDKPSDYQRLKAQLKEGLCEGLTTAAVFEDIAGELERSQSRLQNAYSEDSSPTILLTMAQRDCLLARTWAARSLHPEKPRASGSVEEQGATEHEWPPGVHEHLGRALVELELGCIGFDESAVFNNPARFFLDTLCDPRFGFQSRYDAVVRALRERNAKR